ncbi:flotillin family protein [Metabacillus sp. RGM 3146]|uniref:flotillin family protein n=1 Tax=Metabacillus sp. RGM 3146 TaxID=3401092 RepID=UPI003B995CA4
MIQTIYIIAAVGVLLLGLITFLVKRYKTIGSDEALIVTGSMLGSGDNIQEIGKGRKIKIVSGGGTLVLPFIQQAKKMTLTTYNLHIKAEAVYTQQKVRLGAVSNAVVKIGSDLEMIATASENYMGKTHEEISAEITSILEGHLRAILGKMTVDQAYSDREAFSREVKVVAEPDLHKLGFEIRSFNVKDYVDVDKYLEAQSRKQIADVKKEAEIAESEANKLSRIKRSENEQEAKRAELERASQTSEAEKDNALKMSQFQIERDKAKADADMAYSLQKAIREKEVKEQEMNVKIVEKTKDIELQEKENERRQREYHANINLKADAEAYEVEKKAEADKKKRQLEAEAKQYEIEAQAKADAEKVRLAGKADSEAVELRGKAEASVIEQKGISEAKAQTEKAKAFEQYGEAARLEMILASLPALAEQLAKPLGNVDSIKIIDTGNGGGVQNLAGSVTGMFTQLQNTLKDTTGLDLVDVINNYAGKHNLKGELSDIAFHLRPDLQKVVDSVNMRSMSDDGREG